ncbi:predicted protein [Chaetoceros tenuissimus]|uniref:Uncharacterized protein n=1 Tax=Chaetoceros tenuissimus TaxID=426638 RepID=A0AAD3D0K0_9STRA|nr:predicted protein [Chaetoceros tenuissimus]
MPSQGRNLSISSSSIRSNPIPINRNSTKHERSKVRNDIEYVKKHYDAKTWEMYYRIMNKKRNSLQAKKDGTKRKK